MFGERIKEMRQKSNMTQETLGKLIGVGKTTVSQYESETRSPDINTFIKLSDIFGCSIDYLVGKEDFNKSVVAAHNDGNYLNDKDLELKINRAIQKALKEERDKRK